MKLTILNQNLTHEFQEGIDCHLSGLLHYGKSFAIGHYKDGVINAKNFISSDTVLLRFDYSLNAIQFIPILIKNIIHVWTQIIGENIYIFVTIKIKETADVRQFVEINKELAQRFNCDFILWNPFTKFSLESTMNEMIRGWNK